MQRRFIFIGLCSVAMLAACGKADSQVEELETVADPQMELTEEQGSSTGLTQQQQDQAIAAIVASGMTKEQAEAMLAMADGTPPVIGESGMPVALEEIAAMDPRVIAEAERAEARAESIKSSGVTLQYGGVEYPLQYTKTPQCGDFFGFSSAGFLARTSPDAERGPTLSFGSGFTVDGAPGYSFVFWQDFDPENMFDPKYATAHITLLDKGDHITGFGGHADSGAALDLTNSKGLIIEDTRLFYEGPVSADSGKIMTIEVIFCPK